MSSFDPDAFAWTVASKGLETDAPSFLRICQIPKDFARSNYPERIHIYWTMARPDHSGLPTPEESQMLQSFEDRLTRAVLPDKHAVLVVTATSEGVREYLFYAKDVEGFMLRLQDMPHPHGRYPIELEQESDPGWSSYNRFASGLHEA